MLPAMEYMLNHNFLFFFLFTTGKQPEAENNLEILHSIEKYLMIVCTPTHTPVSATI